MDNEIRNMISAIEEAIEDHLDIENKIEKDQMIEAGNYLIWLIKNIIELREQELDDIKDLE